MQPLVSIITPTYNHQPFIGACIESVQAQTFPNWEMIVVDDGSTDRTASVVREYAAKDDRIKLFEQANVGIYRLHETYNFAVGKSSGEFVAVLEGDDVWEPQKLKLQVSALRERGEAVLSWGDAMFVSTDLTPMRASRSGDGGRDKSSFNNEPVGSILSVMYVENVVPAATVMIRRSALEEIGGFQHRRDLPLVDYPTILTLATRGPFAYVDRPVAKWRLHPEQATKTYRAQIIKAGRDLALEHFDTLTDDVRAHVRLSRQQIERNYRRKLHRSYVESGRYKLAHRKFQDARTDYFQALFYPGIKEPLFRLAALVGIGCSLIGIDLEWLARLTRRQKIA